MSKPQDFVTDNNPTAIFHLDRSIGTPDYVKSASIISQEDVEGLPNMAFADTVGRRWPLFSKTATWCSAADFFGNRPEGLDEVADNIRKAADLFGIRDDVDKVEAEFSKLTKKASTPERKFALVVDFDGAFGNAQTTGFYPINEYGEVLTSAERMLKDASEGALPLEYLRSASVELVKAASEHDVPLDEIHDKLVRYGTLRMPDFDKAAEALAERVSKYNLTEDQAAEYNTIIDGAREEFDKTASEDLDAAVEGVAKWMELWCSLDREHDVKYANVADPVEAFFSGQTLSSIRKMASSHVIIRDLMIPRAELMALPTKDIELRFREKDASIIKAARDHCVLYKDEIGTGYATDMLDQLDDSVAGELLELMASRI